MFNNKLSIFVKNIFIILLIAINLLVLCAFTSLGTIKKILIEKNESYYFTKKDFDSIFGKNNFISAIRIIKLPGSGYLTYQKIPVLNQQIIDSKFINQLVFTPAFNESGEDYAFIKFKVQDSHLTWSQSYTLIISVSVIIKPRIIISGYLVNLLIHFNKSKKELVKILIEEKKKNGEKVSNMQLESDVLKASWKMKAIIKGNNFKIAAISEEIQAMTLNDATEWKWQIKALKEGVQSLHLSITAIFEMNGEEERKTFRTYDRTIEVIVKKKIIYFISTNWYWIVTIITTLTTIFITWFTAYLAKNKLHKYNQKKTIKSKKRIKSRKRRKL